MVTKLNVELNSTKDASAHQKHAEPTRGVFHIRPWMNTLGYKACVGERSVAFFPKDGAIPIEQARANADAFVVGVDAGKYLRALLRIGVSLPGRGAGGQTVTESKCIVCLNGFASPSTVREGLCKSCHDELTYLLNLSPR